MSHIFLVKSLESIAWATCVSLHSAHRIVWASCAPTKACTKYFIKLGIKCMNGKLNGRFENTYFQLSYLENIFDWNSRIYRPTLKIEFWFDLNLFDFDRFTVQKIPYKQYHTISYDISITQHHINCFSF